ncbi:MAG: hypothetical protein ACOCQ3_03410 [Natronomonas sp.]
MDEPVTSRRAVLAGGALLGGMGWYVATSTDSDGGDAEPETEPAEAEEFALTVDTVAPTDREKFEVSFQGELKELEGTTAATVGFEWREVDETDWIETAAQVLESPGRFRVEISELEPETTYEFRAVAEADGVTEYGLTRSFTTAAAKIHLTVDAVKATDVTGWDATLVGELSELENAESASVGFEWHPAPTDEESRTEEKDWTATDEAVLDSTGTFHEKIDGLDDLTEYEFRAVAEVDDRSDESESRTFTTHPNPNPDVSGGVSVSKTDDDTESDESTLKDGSESGTDTEQTTTYWQVDFGEGDTPPEPPSYWPDDLVAALGNSEDGSTENPSFRRQQTAGQLGDVEVKNNEFEYTDENEPTAVTVEFTVAEDAGERALHLASFVLPGPFATDEIDKQERFEYASASFEGGETGQLTVGIPQK